MKTVNFNVEVMDLQGKPVQEIGEDGKPWPIVLSKFVATLLARDNKATDPVRQLILAQKIYNTKGDIELEDADHKLIEKAVKASGASCIVIARVLEAMEQKNG